MFGVRPFFNFLFLYFLNSFVWFDISSSDSSTTSGFSTRSMLSEARAKLELFSSKFPNPNQPTFKLAVATASYNEGTSYLNNLNFELVRNKVCKSFLVTRQTDMNFADSKASKLSAQKSKSDNLLNINRSSNCSSSKF